jgi:hypothetical protein
MTASALVPLMTVNTFVKKNHVTSCNNTGKQSFTYMYTPTGEMAKYILKTYMLKTNP